MKIALENPRDLNLISTNRAADSNNQDFNDSCNDYSDQKIETLFSDLAKTYKTNGHHDFSLQWFKDLSKIIFSRESTYRGLLEMFTDDLPAVIVEAFRGKAAFLESAVRHALSTGLMFITPEVSKFFARYHAQKILGSDLARDHEKLMLFRREDLESSENFNQARKRIIDDELVDKTALLELDGGRNLNATIGSAKDLVKFVKDYPVTDDLRAKVLKLKDSVIKSQTWFEGFTWGLLPFLTRVFRKYFLGLDRFVGSVNYLSDKDADKLGNEKGFSFKQILGTVLSSISSPLLVGFFLDRLKTNHIQPGSLLDFVKKQLDMIHAFYPKLGLFMFQGELPYVISRIFNSQDGFELIENITKSLLNNLSTFFGDRLTNGNIAKSYDKQLKEEFGEDGILYYKENTDKLNGGLRSLIPPEATKFTDVINRTRHNVKLRDKAINLYQKVFYQGFGLHATLMFGLRILINWITKFRVKSALGES